MMHNCRRRPTTYQTQHENKIHSKKSRLQHTVDRNQIDTDFVNLINRTQSKSKSIAKDDKAV